MKLALLLYLAGVVVDSGAGATSVRRLHNELRFSPAFSDVDPEVYMESTELITSKGYPCENHYITTQDGFILNVQRIPHGRNSSLSPVEKPVIILQHGLGGSSSNWLDNLANESLAYLLADRGADVWLGNSRGNMYSKNHTKFKPDQKEFWAWSYDEMAAYDMPALIDHVVRTTGAKQVHYLGHSQGTLIGFAGFSSNHTLAAMVKRFYALAPVAKVRHIESPLRLFAPFTKDLGLAAEILGIRDFLPHNKALMDFLAKDVCDDLSDLLCESVLFVLGGFDRTHLNETRVPVYVAHNPGGTSVQNMLHYGQGVNVDAFQKFDYGSAEANMDHYNQSTPPQYNLPEDFHVPVVTYTGGHDLLADPTDVAWLHQQVNSSLLATHNMPFYEHVDFIWAFDAVKYCYNDILDWVFNK